MFTVNNKEKDIYMINLIKVQHKSIINKKTKHKKIGVINLFLRDIMPYALGPAVFMLLSKITILITQLI